MENNKKIIKFNKITLEFTDANEELAAIKVLTDPSLEGLNVDEIENVDQPCVMLFSKVLGFLNYIKQQTEEGVVRLGESGNNPQTVH